MKLILDKQSPSFRFSNPAYQKLFKYDQQSLSMECDCSYYQNDNFTDIADAKSTIDEIGNITIPFLEDIKALSIQNCDYLTINSGAINGTKDLKSIHISNISHLLIKQDGLSVSERKPLDILISDSSCNDYLPKFSSKTSYQNVTVTNVRIRQNCSCDHDATQYFCQTIGVVIDKTIYQKYEDFDKHNCDHTGHHHSIFDEFTEEYLPNNKFELLAIGAGVALVFILPFGCFVCYRVRRPRIIPNLPIGIDESTEIDNEWTVVSFQSTKNQLRYSRHKSQFSNKSGNAEEQSPSLQSSQIRPRLASEVTTYTDLSTSSTPFGSLHGPTTQHDQTVTGTTRIGTTATSPRIPTFGTSSAENSHTDEISAESAHEYYYDYTCF